MNNMLEIEKMKELQRVLLTIEKEINNMHIEDCEQLIEYYTSLILRLQSSVNEDLNAIFEYESLANLITSVPISTFQNLMGGIIGRLNIKIDILESEMLKLRAAEACTKQKILDVQKRKIELINKNVEIDQNISMINFDNKAENGKVKTIKRG